MGLLTEAFRASESDQGGAARFVRAHSLANALLDLHLHVELHLLPHFPIPSTATDQIPHPHQPRPYSVHDPLPQVIANTSFTAVETECQSRLAALSPFRP